MRHVLLRFTDLTVWSLVREVFHRLGLSSPRQVQAGCIEILLEPMTSDQAQALLETRSQLEKMLNKVCLHVITIILV